MHNFRRLFRPGLAVALVAAALTVQGLPAVANDGVVKVSARLVQVLAEDADDTGIIGTGADGHEESDDPVSMVEVGGRLVALPDDITVDGATGDKVQLTIEGAGRATGAEAVFATGDEASPATVVDIEVRPGKEVAAATAPGTLTILPVYWSGGTPSTTIPELRALGSATASYWSTQSGGSISTAVEVKPWLDARSALGVDVPTSCSNQAMATLVTQVMAVPGYSGLAGTAGGSNRIAVYFPRWSACGWAGLGSVAGTYSWINGYTNPEVLAHEYGHNLGLGHADRYDCVGVPLTLPTASCYSREYGDTADVMGSGTLTGRPGNLNSAMADWLGTARVVTAQPGKTTTATLSPLGSVSSVRAVSVPVSGGTVYVDFRPNVLPDTRKPAWAGVQVRMQSMTSYYPTTYLLDMHPDQSFANPTLGVGESWQVPSAGLEISVTAINGTSSASVKVTPVAATDTVHPSDLGFVPVKPARLLDTRQTSAIKAGGRVDLKVAGTAGVPADAKAVALTITGVGSESTTFLRVWPTGQAMPTTSNLNPFPGRTVAVGAVAEVGSGGRVSVYNNAGSVDVVVDVTGYYVTSGGVGFAPLAKATRLYDSRTQGGLVPGATKRLKVAGLAGVPTDATAVMVNVASAAAAGAGYVSVVPAGDDVRGTAVVNHWAGTDVAVRATIPLSGGGVDVYVEGGRADVVIDVVGWYGPSGSLLLTLVTPQRVVDTRVGGSCVDAKQTRTFAVRDAIVTDDKPVLALGTLAATQQTSGTTYMTVAAAGGTLPTTSDMNTGAGRDQAALVLLPWDSAGRTAVYNNAGSTHVVVDVTAVFR